MSILIQPGKTSEIVVTTASGRAFASFTDSTRLFEWLRGRDPKVEYKLFLRTTLVEALDLSKLGSTAESTPHE